MGKGCHWSPMHGFDWYRNQWPWMTLNAITQFQNSHVFWGPPVSHSVLVTAGISCTLSGLLFWHYWRLSMVSKNELWEHCGTFYRLFNAFALLSHQHQSTETHSSVPAWHLTYCNIYHTTVQLLLEQFLRNSIFLVWHIHNGKKILRHQTLHSSTFPEQNNVLIKINPTH